MHGAPARVFLVEDDPDFAMLIEHGAAKRPDWMLAGRADTLAAALIGIQRTKPDVVLLDLGLPDSDGLATVDAVVERFHPLAVVVLTSLDSSKTASEALRAGAQDYLDKADASPAVLARTVRYAQERARYASTIARQQQALAEFATHAAHDLKAPLRSMSVFAQILTEDLGPRLEGEELECLNHIVEGADRMRALVSDLIAYARAGYDEPFGAVDIMAVLGRLHDQFRAEIESAGILLDTGYVPPVWGQQTPVRQALQNLVGNAIKFRSREKPVVRVSGFSQDGRTYIEVYDNGIGIPGESVQRATHPFSRAHDLARYPGSGLGLALVDRVVRRHGGRVRIDSEVGRGTTVRIDLPTDATSATARP